MREPFALSPCGCLPLVVALLTIAACGGRDSGSNVGTDSGSSSRHDAAVDQEAAAGTGMSDAPNLLIGELLVDQFPGNPNPTEQLFSASFVPAPESDAGPYYATCAVGACCYLPPSPPRPVPTQPPGCGSVVPDKNAGVITLVDTTSRAQIGTFPYVNFVTGGGCGGGYPFMGYTAPVWRPGDILTVHATGDQVSAFTVSAPALIPPIGQIPSSINLDQDFQITWQPDPNADIMNISISGGQSAGGVNCTLPDAKGSVTVATSLLLAAFQLSDAIMVSLGRVVQREAQTSLGTVEFTSRADSASVQVSDLFEAPVAEAGADVVEQ